MSKKTLQRLNALYAGMYMFAEDLVHDHNDFAHSIWVCRTCLQYLMPGDRAIHRIAHVESSMWSKQRILSYTRKVHTHWYAKYMRTP